VGKYAKFEMTHPYWMAAFVL